MSHFRNKRILTDYFTNHNYNFQFTTFTGENDVTEKNIDPIIVYSEKELFREFEKIASNLVPEKDWSVRIAAMQRIEGLVFGGLFFLVFRFICIVISSISQF